MQIRLTLLLGISSLTLAYLFAILSTLTITLELIVFITLLALINIAIASALIVARVKGIN